MPEQLIPQDELDNLKEQIPEVRKLLDSSPEARIDFFKNPFAFLRRKFHIWILGRIADSNELINDFNNSVKFVLEKIKAILNECFACKLSSVILIYGALANLGLPVVALVKKADVIVEMLEKYSKGTSEDANKTLEKLKGFVDWFRPSTLAIEFCELSGFCPAGSW